MTVLLYLVVYAAALVFAGACIFRTVSYARTPIHLRWELYPVPHEDPERVKHGGSYFETLDWWTRPRQISLAGELRFMIVEIFFLKGLWEHNRRMWYRSFPFHFGLYLLIATLTFLAFGGALSVLAPTPIAVGVNGIIRLLIGLTGTAGSALATLGALGLLLRRMTDENLRIYTTVGDIFNLVCFLATLVVLAAGYLSRGSSSPDLLAISSGLLTFDVSLEIPMLLSAGLMLSAFLVAYVPLTHMSHFIAKFFTYHSVRWDDLPNRRGGELEPKIAESLTYRPTWAAPHLGADGRKTWAQVVAGKPASEAKK
ncbi:MAG: respiratory nitrate reductase subunit gamma [Acidobacteriia bacterium]|nr:respiratory nitrate reductase subunit gamma [Terriglobia bacterium]